MLINVGITMFLTQKRGNEMAHYTVSIVSQATKLRVGAVLHWYFA